MNIIETKFPSLTAWMRCNTSKTVVFYRSQNHLGRELDLEAVVVINIHEPGRKDSNK